jgi:hypothetical protein
MISGKPSKIYLVSCLFIFTILFFNFGKAFADQWSITYGGSGVGEARAVQQTSEGGYIVIGHTDSLGQGDQDLWILKLKIDGQTQWQKTYGGSSEDKGRSIQQTSDEGYIVAGTTESFGAGEKDAWVIKLDKDGNIQWQKTYGGEGEDQASAIQQTSDEGYIVAGTTESFGAGKKDAWVIKLDKDGNIQWQKTYGNIGDEEAYSIQEIHEGGYILAGSTYSYAYLGIDAWVLKLDKDGIIQWQRSYGGSGNDKFYSIRQTDEGGYIVAGSTESFGAGKKDAWVLKLDAFGIIQWERTYGGSEEDEAFFIHQTFDGGYVIAVRSQSFGEGHDEALLLKTDRNGSISGCQIIGTSYATSYPTTISGVSVNGKMQDTGTIPQTSNLTAGNTGGAPNSLCLLQGPDIFVDPISVEFGSVVMGNFSSRTVTVTNVGSKALVIDSLDIGGTNHSDYGIRTDTCSGQTLSSLSQCTVEIGFSPRTRGIKSAILIIPSDDSDMSQAIILLRGEAIPPIDPIAPANHTSFSACSLFSVPKFSWTALGSFRSYEIQFSRGLDFSSIAVKVKSSVNEMTIKSNTWKRILQIPGGIGGPVYWRIFGVFTGGRTAFVSDASSIIIEPPNSVNHPEISQTSKDSLPEVSWENNCNGKFKVWFWNDNNLSKKTTISYALKNPNDNNGLFVATLTSSQWESVKKLVEDQSDSTVYWKVESWDGLNRYSQTDIMNFILQE